MPLEDTFNRQYKFDPRIAAEIILEGRDPLQPRPGFMPQLPALPPRQVITNPSEKPVPYTRPVEQTLADQISGPAIGAYEGGKLAYEGYNEGDPRKMAGGAAVTGMSLLPGFRGRRPYKFERLIEAEEGRFGDPGRSHVGSPAWITTPAGGVLGGYLGSQMDSPDSNAGMLTGGLSGVALGFGGGILPILHHMRKLDEAERIRNTIPRASQSPIPAAVTPPPANPPGRPTFMERMGQGRAAVPMPQTPYGLQPEDLAGPLPSTGGQVRRLQGGRPIYQGADGRWRDENGRFLEQPGGGPLMEGFPENIRRR